MTTRGMDTPIPVSLSSTWMSLDATSEKLESKGEDFGVRAGRGKQGFKALFTDTAGVDDCFSSTLVSPYTVAASLMYSYQHKLRLSNFSN